MISCGTRSPQHGSDTLLPSLLLQWGATSHCAAAAAAAACFLLLLLLLAFCCCCCCISNHDISLYGCYFTFLQIRFTQTFIFHYMAAVVAAITQYSQTDIICADMLRFDFIFFIKWLKQNSDIGYISVTMPGPFFKCYLHKTI